MYTEGLSRSSALVSVQKPGHPAGPWSLCAPGTVTEGQPPASPPSIHPCYVFPLAPSPPSVLTSTPFLTHQPPVLTTQLSHCPAISQHSEGRAHRSLLCVQGDGRRHQREMEQTELAFPAPHTHIHLLYSTISLERP